MHVAGDADAVIAGTLQGGHHERVPRAREPLDNELRVLSDLPADPHRRQAQKDGESQGIVPHQVLASAQGAKPHVPRLVLQPRREASLVFAHPQSRPHPNRSLSSPAPQTDDLCVGTLSTPLPATPLLDAPLFSARPPGTAVSAAPSLLVRQESATSADNTAAKAITVATSAGASNAPARLLFSVAGWMAASTPAIPNAARAVTARAPWPQRRATASSGIITSAHGPPTASSTTALRASSGQNLALLGPSSLSSRRRRVGYRASTSTPTSKSAKEEEELEEPVCRHGHRDVPSPPAGTKKPCSHPSILTACSFSLLKCATQPGLKFCAMTMYVAGPAPTWTVRLSLAH